MGESVRLDEKMVWEIRVKWNDTVMDVLELHPDRVDDFGFSIGEDPACDYTVDASWIAGESRLDLLSRVGAGGVLLRAPSGGRGWVLSREGARKTLGGMILAGEVESCPEYLDAHLFTLEQAIEARLEVGPWTFDIRRGVAEEQVSGSFRVDRRSFIFPGASLLAHGIFFLLIYLIPPQSKAFQMDPLDRQDRYVNAMLYTPSRAVEIPAFLARRRQPESSGEGEGTAQRERVSNRGTRNTQRARRLSREEILASSGGMARGPQVDQGNAAGLGVAGVIASFPQSPFGGVDGFGGDPENALAAFNPGGSGMPCIGVTCVAGTGRGVGGDGSGTIEQGDSWRRFERGPWGANAPDVPLGDRPPSRKGPVVVAHGGTTKGSISKEQVGRIVRRHLPEIRHCYNRGLIGRPELAGRIVVKFIVSGKGLVMQSAVSESSLGDPKVERCIAQAVRRWNFPAPADGGVVVVNYPFQLNSK